MMQRVPMTHVMPIWPRFDLVPAPLRVAGGPDRRWCCAGLDVILDMTRPSCLLSSIVGVGAKPKPPARAHAGMKDHAGADSA